MRCHLTPRGSLCLLPNARFSQRRFNININNIPLHTILDVSLPCSSLFYRGLFTHAGLPGLLPHPLHILALGECRANRSNNKMGHKLKIKVVMVSTHKKRKQMQLNSCTLKLLYINKRRTDFYQ